MANKIIKVATEQPENDGESSLLVATECPYCNVQAEIYHDITNGCAPSLVQCQLDDGGCGGWYAMRVYLWANVECKPIKGE